MVWRMCMLYAVSPCNNLSSCCDAQVMCYNPFLFCFIGNSPQPVSALINQSGASITVSRSTLALVCSAKNINGRQ